MQSARKYASALAAAALLYATAGIAATREGQTPGRDTRPAHQQKKQQKEPPKGFLAAILDYLEGKISIPP